MLFVWQKHTVEVTGVPGVQGIYRFAGFWVILRLGLLLGVQG